MDNLSLQMLLVEDNLTDVLLLEEALDQVPTMKFVLTHVARLDAGLQCLAERRFDAVLLDLGLPDSQGLATLGEMQFKHPGVPIIVLSGLDDENLAVRAVRDGAQDYLVKGKISGTMIALTIRYAIERKRAEEKIRRGQTQLAEAQRIAHLGGWEWDITANHITWSDELCRIFGITPHKFRGTSQACLELIYPADRRQFAATVRKALLDHEPFTCYHRALRPDGQRRLLHGRGIVITDQAGNPIRMVGTAQDVTELNQVEQSLRNAKDQFQAVLDAVPGAVSWISADLQYLGANHHLAEEHRLVPRDFVGQKLGFRGTSPEFEAFVRWFFAGEKAVASREVAVQGNGSPRTNLIVAQKYEQGQAAVFVGVDITAHKQAEKALRQSRDELEMRVTQRTHELAAANVDLHLAKEAADAMSQAKSEFLSRMSHELRTPLNAILGFGQVLEMRDLDPKDSASVEHILKAGRHLLQLINEVLDIATVEAGRMELSPEAIAVSEIIAESLDLLRPLATQHGIRLNGEAALGSPGCVLADRRRLKQVLINLLSNAVKYNGQNGQVTVACVELATGRLRIQVSDTGPGMTPEEMSKLFVPFERLSASQTGIEGTGLGLALSKRLIEAMSGTLDIESVPGQGSTFSVELPLAECPSQTIKANQESALPAVATTAPTPTFTVLLIEDNASNYRLIETILEDRPGIHLIGAMQGSEGLALAHQHCPDLILLDLHLPDIMGWEVLRRLRESPTVCDIPVVIISADATTKQIERLLTPPEGHPGANAYLTKPLNVKEALRVIDSLLPQPEVLEGV